MDLWWVLKVHASHLLSNMRPIPWALALTKTSGSVETRGDSKRIGSSCKQEYGSDVRDRTLGLLTAETEAEGSVSSEGADIGAELSW